MRQRTIDDVRCFRDELTNGIQQRPGELGLKAKRVAIEVPPTQKLPDMVKVSRQIVTYCRDYPAGV